nr:immunoglobulin heavy chain junction region [Mus musculus]
TVQETTVVATTMLWTT